jgi:RNA polymerase sigma-70 factor (ECF subfamily)
MGMLMDEEKQAISLLKEGNINGLETLVRSYYFKAVRSAFLIIGDRVQAEDIVQSEFLSLRKKIQKFDEDRPFRPWFMRCVVNSTLNKLRSNNRLVSMDASLEPKVLNLLLGQIKGYVDPESILEARQLRERVWNALQELSAEQRASIVMRYYLGLNQAEMVERMDAPASSVKWWLHSARERLRELLGPDLESNSQNDKQESCVHIDGVDREQSHG